MKRLSALMISLLWLCGGFMTGAQTAENLLDNPGFEDTFTKRDGVAPQNVAEDWTPWHVPAAANSPAYANHAPYYDEENARVRGDAAGKSQVFFSQYATHQGGVYQQADATTGSSYRFSVYAWVWSSGGQDWTVSENPGNVAVRVGIDPKGGADGESEDILWSTTAVFLYNAFYQYSVIATAESNTVTVFVESTIGEPVANSYIWLDDAVLEAAPESPASTPASATPAATDAMTPTQVPTATETLVPTATDTPVPTTTATPEPSPTAIVREAFTDTPEPSVAGASINEATPTREALEATVEAPSDTPEPPSDTPEPATDTPEPATATQEPATATPEPATATQEPATATPEPATDTPEPATATLEPPTATREPDTATPEPPTATPVPDTPTPESPTATLTPTAGQFADSITHTVAADDTLSGIALQYGSTVAAIMEANGMSDTVIVVGAKLIVPLNLPTGTPTPLHSDTPTPTATDLPPTATATVTPTPTATPIVHVVRQGDTLLAIANFYGLSVSILETLNGISDPNDINIGQALLIPTYTPIPPTATFLPTITPTPTPSDTPTPQLPPGSTYTVVAGDTLEAIAEQFNTTVAALVELNNLENPSRIYIGQVLRVTAGESVTGTPAPTATDTPTPSPTPLPSPQLTTYIVQTGDTLFGIANFFGVSVYELGSINGITDFNSLTVGQSLVIPG